MISCVCWLVHLFVSMDDNKGSDFSKSRCLIFTTFGTGVQHLHQMSLLTFERSGSKFKVKTAVLKIFHLQ